MAQHLYIATLTGWLYTIDCATGNALRVGPTGQSFIADIAFYSCEGMYAIDFTNFYTVNPFTAASTLVGPLGTTAGLNSLVVSQTGAVYSAGYVSGDFFSINPATGNATLIGNYGAGLTSPGDLAFDSSGVLYATVADTTGTQFLATVDLATGAATIIGPIGFRDVYGLDFYCCHLFGATAAGELLVINPATGAGTLIGNTGLPIAGMSANPCFGC